MNSSTFGVKEVAMSETATEDRHLRASLSSTFSSKNSGTIYETPWVSETYMFGVI